MQLANGASERGGTEHGDDPSDAYYNPDEDGDGLGDNIAFTVPSEINFVSDSAGVLTGPSASVTYIENESVFAIHGSSLKVDAEPGWNIVADATASSRANAIDFQVGPAGDMLDAHAHLTKAAVGDEALWNMAHKAAAGGAEKVFMETAGDIANVDKEIASKTKAATMHWYVTPGEAL